MPISWVVLVGLNAGLAWLLKRQWRSVALATLGALVGGCTYLLIGRISAHATTAPPVGLGAPSSIFWGFGWDRVGADFITWNLLGLAALALSASAFMHIRKIRPFRFFAGLVACGGLGILTLADPQPLIALILLIAIATALFWQRNLTHRLRIIVTATAVAYAVCITPFICTGALTHGLSGGYVTMECSRRLENLDCCLTRYAIAHDDRLPTATTIQELMQKLQPFVVEDRNGFAGSIFTCPLGAAFEKDPKPYTWNSRFSGMSLEDAQSPAASDNDAFMCPYHDSTSQLWIDIARCRKGSTTLGSPPFTTRPDNGGI